MSENDAPPRAHAVRWYYREGLERHYRAASNRDARTGEPIPGQSRKRLTVST